MFVQCTPELFSLKSISDCSVTETDADYIAGFRIPLFLFLISVLFFCNFESDIVFFGLDGSRGVFGLI